ncbi:ATP-binding cassette domain-containing protein, partial [Faecalibacterium prausnitzii]|uniref:ATP-binding cassette domain-containing protein n=1 Tax=Faecalibacterium prausnitzii TaxID=853 RepID=UPI001EDDAF5D
KSMTLRCIAGIVKPDRGRIVLDGRVLFDSAQHIDLPPQQRGVGLVFQNYALFPNMTVDQNILCGLKTEKH